MTTVLPSGKHTRKLFVEIPLLISAKCQPSANSGNEAVNQGDPWDVLLELAGPERVNPLWTCSGLMKKPRENQEQVSLSCPTSWGN